MKLLPYFEDRFDDAVSKKTCQFVYEQASEFLGELLEYSDGMFEFCLQIGNSRHQHVDRVLQGLSRHNLAYLDSIKVLLASGCAEGCEPLLRSILESTFGIAHIVEEKSEERALAYKFARITRHIKHLRRGDLTHSAGKQLHTELANDAYSANVLSQVPAGMAVHASQLEAKVAADPAFAPIVAEWNRVKGKRQGDPEWYSLFGGANNIRELAKKLRWQSMYDFLYRDYSNAVHAGNTVERALTHGNELCPLRHPSKYLDAFSFAYCVTINGLEKLLGFYDVAKQEEMRKVILGVFEPKHQNIRAMIDEAFKGYK
jgi:hypothetical protein